MTSYKAYQKRKENASPYANQANCSKCKYGDWVRTNAFCSGFGSPRKIRYADWDTEKTGYCTQFMPREIDEQLAQEEMRDYCECWEPTYNPEDGSM